MADNDVSDQTIPFHDDEENNNKRSTTKFLGDIVIEEVAESGAPTFASSQPPWRVALDILDANVQLVFDLRDSVILGRSYPQTTLFEGIDLSPFDAYKSGLSRNHAALLLEGGSVIIRDLESMNGTALNGKRLDPKHSYILNSGDRINLAKLKLRIRFLHSPFAT